MKVRLCAYLRTVSKGSSHAAVGRQVSEAQMVAYQCGPGDQKFVQSFRAQKYRDTRGSPLKVGQMI